MSRRERPLAIHRLAVGAIIAMLAFVVLLAARGPVWWQRMYHPLRYESAIREAAARHDVDPYLVAAVIQSESGFDPGEVSERGAIGLMQLMPQTAEDMLARSRLGDKRQAGLDEEVLKDPESNIELGCAYLGTLMRKYGDARLALAAYNAGSANVDKWLKEGATDAMQAIRFPETRVFVRKVLRERDKYRKLYPAAFRAAEGD